jgi:hypothetical protein
MIMGEDEKEDKPTIRKRKTVSYDRGRVYKCMMSDWLGTVPQFDDKQFERTFRIKRSLVHYSIRNLARYDSFWTQSWDAMNRLSILPFVKFLAGMRWISYGVSFSAFQDYFQMGKSTA